MTCNNFPSLSCIKQGDTLDLLWELPLDVGILFPVLAASVKTTGLTFTDTLTVTPLTPSTTMSRWNISATELQTALWPLQELLCDIKHITAAGKVTHTETFILPITQAITP